MTNSEYLAKHILINADIKKRDVNDEEFNELSELFYSLSSDAQREISNQILHEIIILYKSRGFKTSTFKQLIRNFDASLVLYDIFGDKVFEQKTAPNPPVSSIGVK